MAIDVTDTVLGAAIGFATFQVMDGQISGDGSDGSDGSGGDGTTSGTNGDGTMADETDMSDEKLQELLEIQKRQHGGAESIDSYASEVLDLPDGAVGTVTVTPRDGFDLRVKKSYFDRRSDHNYTHQIDGTKVSSNHQAILRSARKVIHGGKIVAEVENVSGSPSTVDFEFEGWGFPSEKSG